MIRSTRNTTLAVALALPIAASAWVGCKSGSQGNSGGPAGSASAALSASARRTGPRTPEEKYASGSAAYTKYCALCHGPEGKGYAADNAPSLVTETFLATATDAYFTRTVRNGRPGTAMGSYAKSRGGPMSDEEILDILTFLRKGGPAQISLPMTPVKGDVARGQTVYDAECTRCHGTPAERGEAPHLSNIELLQAAPDSFLRYTIVHGRKGTKMEPFEGKLTDAQIDDVVALLRSWVPAPPPRPTVEPVNIPDNLPVVLNPKGSAPVFTLRDEKFVPAEQVNQALKDKKKIVILDARSPAEWARLRIPGALPAPHYEKERLDKIPNDDTWVVAYCACPHHASGEVVDELRRRGHANAVILDEGILVWQQKGYPIAGETATAASGSASARAPGAAPSAKPKPIERNTIPFGPPPF